MALDRNLSLNRVAPPSALPAGRGAGDERGCSLIPASSVPTLAAAGWEDIALVIPAGGTGRLAAALAEDWTAGANRYALMERHGVLVVSPCRAEGDGLLLAGGSYSGVSLHVADGRPIVRKRLSLDGQITQDRELRQLQEIEWLAAVPPAVGELFAPVLGTTRSAAALELTTGFVPGYTLAELVFQGRLGGRELAEALAHVYSTVSSVLWTRPPPSPLPGGRRESYVQRIRRRIRTILASGYAEDGVLRRFLQTGSVVVNGRECLGVERLLEILEHDRRWAPIVNPPGRTLCHGDLILEDILIGCGAPHGFSLVDPNPVNENPIYDLGKTMMSLWLGYELIYFDRFSVEWTVKSDDLLALEIETSSEEVSAVYLEAAERFMSFVEHDLVHHLSLPQGEIRVLLRMSAAIHMLAITVFHLLHHKRERRALAFAGTALLNAQAALDS
jgi:hypothetical protein